MKRKILNVELRKSGRGGPSIGPVLTKTMGHVAEMLILLGQGGFHAEDAEDAERQDWFVSGYSA